MPMSPEEIKEMQSRNAAAAPKTPRTHEQRVEHLLGWIVVATGVVAVVTLGTFLLALSA
jgi:hypothetical protein